MGLNLRMMVIVEISHPGSKFSIVGKIKDFPNESDYVAGGKSRDFP